MATSFKPVKGKQYIFNIGLVDAAATTKLKLFPTLAAGDVKISIDGGVYNNLATLPIVNGIAVKVVLSATEMNGDNIVVVFIDAAGSEWCDQLIDIETREQALSTFHFTMRDTTGNPATGKTVTVTRAIDNGTFAAGTIGAVTEIGSGLYRVVLPLADMNATDCVSLLATASGCIPSIITLNSVY